MLMTAWTTWCQVIGRPKRHRRGWFEPCWIGPLRTTEVTSHAIRVEGRKLWFHKHHCTVAVEPDRPVTNPDDTWSNSEDESHLSPLRSLHSWLEAAAGHTYHGPLTQRGPPIVQAHFTLNN